MQPTWTTSTRISRESTFAIVAAWNPALVGALAVAFARIHYDRFAVDDRRTTGIDRAVVVILVVPDSDRELRPCRKVLGDPVPPVWTVSRATHIQPVAHRTTSQLSGSIIRGTSQRSHSGRAEIADRREAHAM